MEDAPTGGLDCIDTRARGALRRERDDVIGAGVGLAGGSRHHPDRRRENESSNKTAQQHVHTLDGRSGLDYRIEDRGLPPLLFEPWRDGYGSVVPPARLLPRVAIVHVLATWFMVGMIWTIHLVHYPLFAEVGPESYVGFQSEHVERIGALLAVPWLTEGLTLVVLLWFVLVGKRRDIATPVLVGAMAMATVLVISGFWSAPAHGELADGFDAAVHDRLMTANLVRALAWSVRGACATWIVVIVTRPQLDAAQSDRSA